MTRQWGWLSSTLPAFINGYDKPALNAPEQRQQSALTMAEEDDGRIRILQSLRGKICKFEWPVNVFHLSRGAGKRSVAQAISERESRRGAACYQQSTVWRQKQTLVGLLAGAYRQVILACYHHLSSLL